MTILELLTEESEKFNFSKEKIEKAHRFASALVGQSKRNRQIQNMDLSEDFLEEMRQYIRNILNNIDDPKVRKDIKDTTMKMMERN